MRAEVAWHWSTPRSSRVGSKNHSQFAIATQRKYKVCRLFRDPHGTRGRRDSSLGAARGRKPQSVLCCHVAREIDSWVRVVKVIMKSCNHAIASSFRLQVCTVFAIHASHVLLRAARHLRACSTTIVDRTHLSAAKRHRLIIASSQRQQRDTLVHARTMTEE